METGDAEYSAENAADPAAVAPSGENAPASVRYADSRAILKTIAERLRNETDIDIDELIPLVDQASAAYKICRERVDAVEKMIQERLPQDTGSRSPEDEF